MQKRGPGPANSEIIIEAEIAPDEVDNEGPFGEFAGYMGQVEPRPVARITWPAHRPSELLAFVKFHGIFADLRLLAIQRLSSNSATRVNARTRTLASTAGLKPIAFNWERASSCIDLGALRAQRTLAARRAISLLVSGESFAARAVPPFALPLGSPIASILLYACIMHAQTAFS
jgi:hypothetical protein